MEADLPPAASYPLNLGPDDCFSRAADLLRQTGFTEKAICARLGIEQLHEIDHPVKLWREKSLNPRGDLLDAWVELFVRGGSLDRQILEGRILGPPLEALLALDMIRLDESRGRYLSPVRLVSTDTHAGGAGGILIACDRRSHPDGSPVWPSSDHVFSAHNALTQQFLGIMPENPAGSVLDLCTGTGVAALAAAASAGMVVGTDISPRSVHFASFNSRLNRVRNVELRCGDLYAPVPGLRFDLVTAHPPYVPSFFEAPIYRGGGEAGDRIVRGILSGVWQHLNPGGSFVMLCIAMDAEGKLFEERVREWMGNPPDLDLILAVREQEEPEAFGLLLASRSIGAEQEVLERWQQLAASTRISRVVYGALAGRRFTTEGSCQSRRVPFKKAVRGAQFERMFAWFDWLRLPEAAERILRAHLRIAPDSRLEIGYGAETGEFIPDMFRFTSGGGVLSSQLETEAWIASTVVAFGQAKQGRQAYKELKNSGKLPVDAGERDFAELLLQLVERDILRSASEAIPALS